MREAFSLSQTWSLVKTRFATFLIVFAFAAAACTAGGSTDAVSTDPASSDPVSTDPTSTVTPGTSAAAPGTTVPPATLGTDGVIVDDEPRLTPELTLVSSQWGTDFARRTIDLSELSPGILATDPRDRIRPIDEPTFEAVADAAGWLDGREPGLLFEFGNTARFYPLQILTLHEIVNDVAAGAPVAVTYCPLCNTGVVFDRTIDGEVHRFGVSGLLRNSDLVMWDDRTESLWQQITGEGIVGALAGRSLTMLPSAIVRFEDFRSQFPDGEVLSRDTGFPFPYGVNPYPRYTSGRPFAFRGETDPRYPALERVVGIAMDDVEKAYPFSEISPVGAVNDTLGSLPIVVFWGATETADALDAGRVAEGQGIGTGIAFERTVGDRVLTFERIDDTTFRDVETGTTWNLLGRAISGELSGSRLNPVVHRNEFWFAWAAFFPDALVYDG